MFQYLQGSQTFARLESRLETTAPNSKMLLTLSSSFFVHFAVWYASSFSKKWLDVIGTLRFFRTPQNIVYNEYNDIITGMCRISMNFVKFSEMSFKTLKRLKSRRKSTFFGPYHSTHAGHKYHSGNKYDEEFRALRG